MSDSSCLWWLRTALRLHDNPVLDAAQQHARCLPVYVFDPTAWEAVEGMPFRKAGEHRARFLLESLADLEDQLNALGSGIAYRTGSPAYVLAAFAKTTGAAVIYVDDQPGTEEQALFADVARALALVAPRCRLEVIWEKTVYHPDDLPFVPEHCPERFKYFWEHVTKHTLPRAEVDAPARFPSLPRGVDVGHRPEMHDLGFRESEIVKSLRRAYPGGERAGLARLQYYSFQRELLTGYRWSRNRSLGPDYSSKLSPYLSLGCLSARHIWRAVKRYEREVRKNASTYWLLRELIWRDFYQLLALKYPQKMFWPAGIRARKRAWVQDHSGFRRWCNGTTGIPFLDAHLRELDATGFMSNRGRVNASSWLAQDQTILWTWGAAWFESRLIDFDVASNWLNWNFQATLLRPTNPIWQGKKYDANGAYVYSQLPELKGISAPLVHGYFALTDAALKARGEAPPTTYPRPRVIEDAWQWALRRIVGASTPEAPEA